MKIGLLLYGSLDIMTGGFLYDRMLVEYLESQGHRVEVISLPWQSYGRNMLRNLDRHLLRRIAGGGYDLLLQDELAHPSLFVLNERLRTRIDCPIVAIVHHLRISEQHPVYRRPLYRYVERRYLAGLDAVICNSQTTLRSVDRLAGPPRQAIVAVPSGSRFQGLSSGEVEARATRQHPLEYIFVGGIIRRKGVHNLIAAYAQLADHPVRLTLVGSLIFDPRYAHSIRRLIEQHDLHDRVAVLGSLPDAELAARLAQADVLVVPSLYEGFGIVYLEGMAFGLPAIAGAGGATHEIITDGVDGFLVGPGNERALAERLARLDSDRGLLRRVSLAARARFEGHPTWHQTMAPVEVFLRQVAGAYRATLG